MRFMAKTVSTPAASPLWAMRSWTAGWPFARQKQKSSAEFLKNTDPEVLLGDRGRAERRRDQKPSAAAPSGQTPYTICSKTEKYIGTLVYGQRPYREDGTRNTHAAAADSIRIENAIPAIIDKGCLQSAGQNGRQQTAAGWKTAHKTGLPAQRQGVLRRVQVGNDHQHLAKIYDYYKCSGKNADTIVTA